MSTTWKEICEKYIMNKQSEVPQKTRGGSDESASAYSETDSSTPLSKNRRSSFDNEWQMNYMIVNRRDGL